MGIKGEQLLLKNLTAQGNGTVTGPWVDLSDYVAGAFYLVATAITAGSITVSFQMSADGTDAGLITANSGAIPTAELAAPGAVSSPSTVRYPLLNAGGSGAQLPWVRASCAITTGPVTGKVYFIGRT